MNKILSKFYKRYLIEIGFENGQPLLLWCYNFKVTLDDVSAVKKLQWATCYPQKLMAIAINRIQYVVVKKEKGFINPPKSFTEL